MNSGTPQLRVSAVVTAQDRRQFLPAAVRSAIDGGADEVLVVRNFSGPIDGCEGRYRDLPCPAPETNEKHARGVEAATGELVAFLDDDDVWTADKVPRVRERFAARPELAYLCHAHRPVDADGHPVEATHPELADKDPRRMTGWDGQDFEEFFLHIWPGNSSSTVVRASWARAQLPALREAGWSADTFWMVAALSDGRPIELEPEPLSLLRLHDQNMSQTRGSDPEQFRERHRIMSERFARSTAVLARLARERGKGPRTMAPYLAERAEGYRFFAALEAGPSARRAAWRALRRGAGRTDRAVRGAALVTLLSPSTARHLLYRSSVRRWRLQ